MIVSRQGFVLRTRSIDTRVIMAAPTALATGGGRGAWGDATWASAVEPRYQFANSHLNFLKRMRGVVLTFLTVYVDHFYIASVCHKTRWRGARGEMGARNVTSCVVRRKRAQLRSLWFQPGRAGGK